jgi:hypothetical protein
LDLPSRHSITSAPVRGGDAMAATKKRSRHHSSDAAGSTGQ